VLSTVFKCGAVDEIKVAKNPLSIRNSQSNTYIKTKHLQSYSTSNRSYPFCDFDEVVDKKVLSPDSAYSWCCPYYM